ncbi:uncharacterized protein [Ptychodera flava]|uniref:uncharacterized protein n=1 Tax=Ptychodera flava TaxID=63121 RepID=UPI00396A8149
MVSSNLCLCLINSRNLFDTTDDSTRYRGGRFVRLCSAMLYFFRDFIPKWLSDRFQDDDSEEESGSLSAWSDRVEMLTPVYSSDNSEQIFSERAQTEDDPAQVENEARDEEKQFVEDTCDSNMEDTQSTDSVRVIAHGPTVEKSNRKTETVGLGDVRHDNAAGDDALPRIDVDEDIFSGYPEDDTAGLPLPTDSDLSEASSSSTFRDPLEISTSSLSIISDDIPSSAATDWSLVSIYGSSDVEPPRRLSPQSYTYTWIEVSSRSSDQAAEQSANEEGSAESSNEFTTTSNSSPNEGNSERSADKLSQQVEELSPGENTPQKAYPLDTSHPDSDAIEADQEGKERCTA